jgi:Ig-like domain-containing protein
MAEPRRFSSTVHRGVGSLLLATSVLMIACTSDQNAQSSDAAARQPAGRNESVSARAAAFAAQTVPAEMVADRSYTVSVRMRNTGTSAWKAAEDYRLGSVNPPDNEVWGFHRVAVPAVVAPGAEVTFTFALRAPRTPGEYNFQWRMVQDGVEWFGEETPNVLITVGRQASQEAR